MWTKVIDFSNQEDAERYVRLLFSGCCRNKRLVALHLVKKQEVPRLEECFQRMTPRTARKMAPFIPKLISIKKSKTHHNIVNGNSSDTVSDHMHSECELKNVSDDDSSDGFIDKDISLSEENLIHSMMNIMKYHISFKIPKQ